MTGTSDRPCTPSCGGTWQRSMSVGPRSMLLESDVARPGARRGSATTIDTCCVPVNGRKPLSMRPWSPIMSPWSDVNTTIVLSSWPSRSIAAIIRPTPSSMNSIMPYVAAMHSRISSWSVAPHVATHIRCSVGGRCCVARRYAGACSRGSLIDAGSSISAGSYLSNHSPGGVIG